MTYFTDFTEERAEKFEQQAADCLKREAESFERCDTDGYLSQWASSVMATNYKLKAEICRAGGVSEFNGLYKGEQRLKAKVINGQYGHVWLVHEDDQELAGRKFIPTGSRSKVQKELGLCEKPELASAWVTKDNRVFRTGDEWGTDALLVNQSPATSEPDQGPNPVSRTSSSIQENDMHEQDATQDLQDAQQRLDEINQWFKQNPYWRLTDDHRDFKQGHAREMEQINLNALIKKLSSGEAL